VSKLNHYTATWAQTGKPSCANVSFDARTDREASNMADRIAYEVESFNTPRTLMRSGVGLIETLNSGTKENHAKAK
jgi:hypothetical protein